jgi:lipid II:glycine glycyltransferase (peptidoglycan interpeptide bridge formation enzyme)
MHLDRNYWADFVCNHPQGNIFQTPQMYEVYLETPNFEPVVVAAVRENQIVGILVGVIQKVLKGVLARFSSRSVIMGGPLVGINESEVTEGILAKYDQIVKRKAIFSEFRNLYDTSGLKSSFHSVNYSYVKHLNILVDLQKSKDELWKDIEKRKRNRIRKAYKVGTEVEVEDSDEALGRAYDILSHVYKRVKLPLPDRVFFENLRKKLTGNSRLKVFVAKHEGKIIGCSFSLVFNSSIYDYYAGAYSNHYEKCPNDLIPWEVFLWGKSKGYTTFDFGGAGKPDVSYGVRNYKKKFGGEFVDLGRYEKVHQPILFFFAKKAFKIWQKLKGKF